MISTVILTLNEELNISECLNSIPWKDDLHVIDSGSKDKTIEIAQSKGATVHHRDFTTYADQRNFALSLDFEYDWILMIDADERLTSELVAEIGRVITNASGAEETMYRMRRKDMFMGRWLKRSSGYPSWFPRLFRKGFVRVDRPINEEYLTDGKVGHLESHLIHYPFNKGMAWWFERHNSYSSMEAVTLGQEKCDREIRIRDILSRDPMRRRACLKQMAYRVPARPFIVFFYLYIVRGGLIDGVPGYYYACMRMAYEIMIDVKRAHKE